MAFSISHLALLVGRAVRQSEYRLKDTPPNESPLPQMSSYSPQMSSHSPKWVATPPKNLFGGKLFAGSGLLNLNFDISISET